MGAGSREELLNGQVNQLNFKVARKLFQTKGVTWRETESSPEGEKYICRDSVRRQKNWNFLQQGRK